MKNNIFNLRALLISCFLVLGMSAFAQVTASGTVTDAANGEPIIGASVLEIGTTTGTITDFDGNFCDFWIWSTSHNRVIGFKSNPDLVSFFSFIRSWFFFFI